MQFVMTLSGAGDADPMVCSICSYMDGALATAIGSNLSSSAASWNAGLKPPGATHDAKSGTNVCSWEDPTGQLGVICGVSATLAAATLYVFYGTDDKWYMAFTATYDEGPGPSYTATVSGEIVFNGAGAPMACGTPGEVTPTFSLTIPLSLYNETGAPACFPPTGVLVEGDPQ